MSAVHVVYHYLRNLFLPVLTVSGTHDHHFWSRGSSNFKACLIRPHPFPFLKKKEMSLEFTSYSIADVAVGYKTWLSACLMNSMSFQVCAN